MAQIVNHATYRRLHQFKIPVSSGNPPLNSTGSYEPGILHLSGDDSPESLGKQTKIGYHGKVRQSLLAPVVHPLAVHEH